MQAVNIQQKISVSRVLLCDKTQRAFENTREMKKTETQASV